MNTGTPVPSLRRVDRGPDSALLAELLEAARTRGTTARFPADGYSMIPLIRAQDVLELQPLSLPGNGPATMVSVRRGDVVAARRPSGSGIVVHRVIALRQGEVMLRGDNTPQPDGSFTPDAILGVVTRVERQGHLVWFGSGRWGPVVAALVRVGAIRALIRLLQALHAASRLDDETVP